MAKRKDSVALFEVITATRRKEAAAEREPQLTRTPKWWFKGGPGHGGSQASPAAADPNDPTAGAVLPPPYVPAQLAPPPPSTEQAPAAPPSALVQRVVPVSSHVAQAATVQIPVAVNDLPPRRAWFGLGAKKLGLDYERQEVTLRFRYTTAIIAGFAILVVVGLAYVSGRRSSPAVAATNSPSSEDLRRGDVLAHVLDIGPDRSIDVAPVPPPPQADPGRRAPQPPGGAKPGANAAAGADYHVGLPRIIGLNYVIIQSYPERKDADGAQKFLQAAGIPCTVERVPEGWSANPNLWSVIGTHGFARPKSMPEYKEYVGAILEASERYAGKSKYKKFEPAGRKWR